MPSHLHLSEELLRRLAGAIRAAQLYSKGHPIIARNLDWLAAALQILHTIEPSVVIGIVSGRVIVDDTPVAGVEILGPVVHRLADSGIDRLTFERGVTTDEIATFIDTIAAAGSSSEERLEMFGTFRHIRVGKVRIEERVEANLDDMATIKQLYYDAVSVASDIWDSAQTEAKPDASVARAMIDGLAQAVAQNRRALLALTTLKHYDNYTFTHMVNVSILTMAQARGLGIDGPLLREFGLAALMHDIGKVNTPVEILNKAAALTEREFAVMQRHTVEGAEILRQTPDIPTLAPVVAFEHHLRMDGSGYPYGVVRPTLNLGTMLCSIADVYDAMRSQRPYQNAFPTDRILAVLKRNDGTQFDQHLVRRFVQLVGIYPVGNLVRLNTGEIAVVLRVHAPDPHRPQVRILFDRTGARVAVPTDVNLWEQHDGAAHQSVIEKPVDPAEYRIDPLSLM